MGNMTTAKRKVVVELGASANISNINQALTSWFEQLPAEIFNTLIICGTILPASRTGAEVQNTLLLFEIRELGDHYYTQLGPDVYWELRESISYCKSIQLFGDVYKHFTAKSARKLLLESNIPREFCTAVTRYMMRFE